MISRLSQLVDSAINNAYPSHIDMYQFMKGLFYMGAQRTYLPGILIVANYLKKYLNSHSTTIENFGGKGLVALLTLVVDLCIIMAQIIDASHEPGDAWDDFTPVPVLDSSVLLSVKGAIDKFYTSLGIAP